MTLYACPKCGKWGAHRGVCDACVKKQNPHCNRTPCFTCGRYSTSNKDNMKMVNEAYRDLAKEVVSAARKFLYARGVENEATAREELRVALMNHDNNNIPEEK